MTNDDVEFFWCVLTCADRENDCLSSKEAVDMIQELQSDITRVVAQKQIQRHVLPMNSKLSVLKKCKQKVQATNSNRAHINVAQQYHWHCAVDEVYNFLRTKNTGLCKPSGKSFGKVMPNFIIGLNEMCLMSNCYGNLQVFAVANKKKQENLLQDSHCSITVVCTRTASAITGPTIFLLKGTKRCNNFNDEYLLKYGMATGSTILMTESAYMTDAAWLEVSKAM
jgi:hypothetical protein